MSSMTHPQPPGQHHTLATGEVILGVDTHKDAHTAAVLDAHGRLLGTRTFTATSSGYADLLHWAGSHGPLHRAGVEGTHSYGAALTRHLQSAGMIVIEVNQPDRHDRRRRGKTDSLDAEAAARAVLSGRATAHPKSGTGPVERIRLFHLARASAVKARTQAINQLKAILVGADATLREHLAGLGTTRLVRACAELACDTLDEMLFATCYTLRLLARRILKLTDEANELTTHITRAINACNPALLDQHGVGPDTAATLLLAVGDNPERVSSEAAFAALCGTNPVEISTGKTHRRRLNRSGNRQANRALYTITISRLANHQPTRDYMQRRLAQGKTRRETIRCLKRYIARQLYPLLTTPSTA